MLSEAFQTLFPPSLLSLLFPLVQPCHYPCFTVCLVWEQLTLPNRANEVDSIMKLWFEQYVSSLERRDHALALLSCLLPSKRHGRVYGVHQTQIIAIVVRARVIRTRRRHTIQKRQDNEHVDCASAIMRTVTEFGDLRGSKTPLTVKEVDGTLDSVAAGWLEERLTPC